MSLKFVYLVSAIAVATAIELRQPLLLKQPIEIEGPVEYEFSYSVKDEHTGDIKAQKEVRKDDRVEGSYELIDPDGYRRLVQYKSDKLSGFEAVVLREPTNIKIPIPEPKRLIATKILSAPLIQYAQAPITKLIRSEPRLVGLEKSDVNYDNHVAFSGLGVSYNY